MIQTSPPAQGIAPRPEQDVKRLSYYAKIPLARADNKRGVALPGLAGIKRTATDQGGKGIWHLTGLNQF